METSTGRRARPEISASLCGARSNDRGEATTTTTTTSTGSRDRSIETTRVIGVPTTATRGPVGRRRDEEGTHASFVAREGCGGKIEEHERNDGLTTGVEIFDVAGSNAKR